MFLFVENWDIGHDDFKEIIAAVQSIKIEKFTNGTEWPLCKRWFTKRLGNYVDTDKFTLDEFMRAITVNRSPRRFAGIIEALIRVACSHGFLKGYDEENGLEMFCKMNLKYMVLSNFEKVKLLRNVINPSIVGLDNAAFKKTITLLCDHFPGLHNVAPYLSLLKVENTDVARYLRTNQLAGNFMEVVQRWSL